MSISSSCPFYWHTVISYDPLYFCGVHCNFVFISYLTELSPLSFLLISMIKSLSILSFQITSSVSVIFSVFFISISALIFMISFLLLTLGFLSLVALGVSFCCFRFLFCGLWFYCYKLLKSAFASSHRFLIIVPLCVGIF